MLLIKPLAKLNRVTYQAPDDGPMGHACREEWVIVWFTLHDISMSRSARFLFAGDYWRLRAAGDASEYFLSYRTVDAI